MVFTKGNQPGSKMPVDREKSYDHPYRMILYLAIVASSMLFLVLLIAFTATDARFVTSEFSIPKPFIIGSFFILFSSFSLAPCVDYFRREDIIRLQKSLRVTAILGFSFVICQYLGWTEMLSRWGDLSSSRSATYLYILSSLHGIHYFAGIIALVVVNWQWYKRRNDAVLNLIAITNPFEELKLELLSIYWHFLDMLWIIVFLFFLFFIY